MSINNPSGPKKETLVEEGTTFKGSISSDCVIVVKGGLEGEIEGPALHVASTGAVSGKVKVTELHSEGVLEGEFDAEVARLSGRVKDKTVIRAKELDVKLSPASGKMELVFGECEVEVGDVPDKQAALEEAAKAAESGDKAKAAESGDKAKTAESGDKAKAAESGDKATAAADDSADDDDSNSKKGKRRGKSETNSPPPN